MGSPYRVQTLVDRPPAEPTVGIVEHHELDAGGLPPPDSPRARRAGLGGQTTVTLSPAAARAAATCAV